MIYYELEDFSEDCLNRFEKFYSEKINPAKKEKFSYKAVLFRAQVDIENVLNGEPVKGCFIKNDAPRIIWALPAIVSIDGASHLFCFDPLDLNVKNHQVDDMLPDNDSM